mmetsp:Transcript_10800/g.35785  ORF Transcript_10800/g.35785 Transcript_10800/m.35785 type:complete len:426 (+) Transcript_10800:135-1412(+)
MGFERRLKRHFDLSRARSVGAQVDYWLTLVALVACIETLGIWALAFWRYSRKVYNLRLQRWTMRILMLGPIYSCLMWCSLWQTSLDYYIAIPVGFYEAYAFYCFYAMLVCFADGEDRLLAALSSNGSFTALAYYPSFFSCGAGGGGGVDARPSASSSRRDLRRSTSFSSSSRGTLLQSTLHKNVRYAAMYKFESAESLLTFIRLCVAQAMIAKPLNVVVMLLFTHAGSPNYANYSRMISIVSLWLVANALTQIYHVVLPRVRGLGGEKLFFLLLLMIAVIGVQDVVCSALLINSGTSSATDDFATRMIFILTILQYTAFSTILYRLLPPEKFAQMTWSNSNLNLATIAPPNAKAMALCDFAYCIVDPTTLFAIPRGREAREASFTGIQCVDDKKHSPAVVYGVKESKEDDSFVYDETSPLMMMHK